MVFVGLVCLSGGKESEFVFLGGGVVGQRLLWESVKLMAARKSKAVDEYYAILPHCKRE